VTQQARNLVMQLGDEHPFRFLVHDRDTKFTHAFDQIFRTEGVKVIRTPIRAPNANAHAERWVRTLRADCLDRILILGRRHLEHVVRVYRRHYNEHRPHRALHLLPPSGRDPTQPNAAAPAVHRRGRLGGLIHEYRDPFIRLLEDRPAPALNYVGTGRAASPFSLEGPLARCVGSLARSRPRGDPGPPSSGALSGIRSSKRAPCGTAGS
jgi:hypothetical protein